MLTLLILPRLAAAGDPAIEGQWSEVMSWPYSDPSSVPSHAHLLPNGKVLYFYSYGDGTKPRIWDPATKSITGAGTPGFNVFCAGHSFLADGRLLVTGGHVDPYIGVPNAAIYNAFTNSWTSAPRMNAPRWYPTNTTLANGDVLVVSGNSTSQSAFNDTPQVYQAGSNSWRTLTSAIKRLPLYPFMFLAPSGSVFIAGWTPESRYLNSAGSGSWSFVARSNYGWRNYGSAVMYRPGKILLVGGGGEKAGGPAPTATAEVIDLNSPTPSWRYVASMPTGRRQHNATLLPDGTVLVTGGSSGSAPSGSPDTLAFDNHNYPVYHAAVWNPVTNTWKRLASSSLYRGYHSFALLLPDGRVLTGGGQKAGSNAQVFSPPYLFKGTRPTISSAPSSVTYGQTASVATPSASSIKRVTWLRLGSVTHSYDQDQRFLELSFTATSGGVNVVFPSNRNLSPPGYYMLFLLDTNGAPSRAKIVRIGGTSTTATCPLPSIDRTVAICQPADGARLSSPVRVLATARASLGVRAMKIYRDGTSVFTTSGYQVDTQLSMGIGTHRITVQAWDPVGEFRKTIYITVDD